MSLHSHVGGMCQRKLICTCQISIIIYINMYINLLLIGTIAIFGADEIHIKRWQKKVGKEQLMCLLQYAREVLVLLMFFLFV